MNNTIIKSEKDFVVLKESLNLATLEREWEVVTNIFPKQMLEDTCPNFVRYCTLRNNRGFESTLRFVEDNF